LFVPWSQRKSPRLIVDLFSRGVSVAGIAAREDMTVKRSRPEMAAQRLEKIESAPGNGMASEALKLQDLVHGRAAERALRLEHGLKSGIGAAAREELPGERMGRGSPGADRRLVLDRVEFLSLLSFR
jgi:hypothetical protein